MSIVVSNDTLVNSDLTSKDTIWNPLEGGNIFEKCFANWYVAVFKFDTIGLIGS